MLKSNKLALENVLYVEEPLNIAKNQKICVNGMSLVSRNGEKESIQTSGIVIAGPTS